MECIAIGIDVSKGRADIAIINQSGTLLAGSGGYDDTRADHDRLSSVLRDLRRKHPEARLIAGVEATGGYERTWVAFSQRERQAGRAVSFHRLNPLAVKRFLESDLHRKVDDARAAQGIARYLLERRRQAEPQAIPLDGRVIFYRNIRGLIEQRAQLRQRFQSLLSSAHPELVQYCDDGIPRWLLLVCRQYPTASTMARGHLKTLAEIPHVGVTKAKCLRDAAKTSTAALDDPGTAAAMMLLAEELLHQDARISDLQKSLISMVKDDPQFQRIDSIPGIGPWSAAALLLEIGDVERFADVRQLIAWAGLDPCVDSSGDGTVSRGISHRGNAYLRAILFPLVMAAMQHHPAVGDFIRRKMNEGKPKKVAMVAGSAKLLRIVFALMATKQHHNPQHEADRKAKAAAQQKQKQRAATEATAPAAVPIVDQTAPVSAKERRRRRNSTINATTRPLPSCEVGPQQEQQVAAPPTIVHST